MPENQENKFDYLNDFLSVPTTSTAFVYRATTLIQELQSRKDLPGQFNCTKICMHVLFIAQQVKDNEKIEWMKKEIGGYDENDDLPPYRMIKNIEVRHSILNIENALKSNTDRDKIIKINGNRVKFKRLEILVLNFISEVFEYVSEIISRLGEKPKEPDKGSLDVPEDVRDFFELLREE